MWFNRKLEKENQQLREALLLKEQQHQSELAELRATIGEYEHMQRTSREHGDLFNQVISRQNQGERCCRACGSTGRQCRAPDGGKGSTLRAGSALCPDQGRHHPSFQSCPCHHG